MNLALLALAIGSFGVGLTELVIMGLLINISNDLNVTIFMAGLLISGYALGVTIGAPVLTVLTSHWSRKRVLIGLMIIFILGNLIAAVAPSYGLLMTARIITALAHGTFFGVGAIVATQVVAFHQRASAIAIMFTGVTVATIVGVPFGTWLGQMLGWRATFWAVTLIGIIALIVIYYFVPSDHTENTSIHWKSELKATLTRPVLLGLLASVLGNAGFFLVFTYIAPILTQISSFSAKSISPILLIFGLGSMIGNLLGGKLADKKLLPTVFGTLLAVTITLVLMNFTMQNKTIAVLFVGLLGITAFTMFAPLQMWILNKASGAGQGLASSLNIAAFNLGAALGAGFGGIVIDYGPGLETIFWVAALLPLMAAGVVFLSLQGEAGLKN